MLIPAKYHPVAKYSATILTAWALSGCAISPDRIGRLDGKPIVTKEQAAMVGWGSSKAFPNQIITRWSYYVKSIDGKPFPKGKSYVQLEPGEYTVTVACGARFAPKDMGWFEGEHTSKIRVESGKIYWAWIGARQDASKWHNGLEYTTAGQCWTTGFSTMNPFLDVAG